MKKRISQDILQAVTDKVVKVLASASSSKQPNQEQPRKVHRKKQRKRNKNKGRTRDASTIPIMQPGQQSVLYSGNKFATSGRPQNLADFDAAHGLRVSGNALFKYPITTSASPNTGGFLLSGANYIWLPLSAGNLDVRLTNIAGVYDYYAFRHVRITYIPSCGSSTSNSLALGLSENFQTSVDVATPTQSQVLTYNPSILTPLWAPATITCRCDGTKVWETSTTASTNNTRYQFVMAAVFGSTPAASTSFGQLLIDYVCDFYQPSMLHSSVNITDEGPPIPSKDEVVNPEITPPSSPTKKKTITIHKR